MSSRKQKRKRERMREQLNRVPPGEDAPQVRIDAYDRNMSERMSTATHSTEEIMARVQQERERRKRDKEAGPSKQKEPIPTENDELEGDVIFQLQYVYDEEGTIKNEVAMYQLPDTKANRDIIAVLKQRGNPVFVDDITSKLSMRFFLHILNGDLFPFSPIHDVLVDQIHNLKLRNGKRNEAANAQYATAFIQAKESGDWVQCIRCWCKIMMPKDYRKMYELLDSIVQWKFLGANALCKRDKDGNEVPFVIRRIEYLMCHELAVADEDEDTTRLQEELADVIAHERNAFEGGAGSSSKHVHGPGCGHAHG